MFSGLTTVCSVRFPSAMIRIVLAWQTFSSLLMSRGIPFLSSAITFSVLASFEMERSFCFSSSLGLTGVFVFGGALFRRWRALCITARSYIALSGS